MSKENDLLIMSAARLYSLGEAQWKAMEKEHVEYRDKLLQDIRYAACFYLHH